MTGQGGDGPRPGEGYKVEIAALKKMLRPLEESVVAAHKIKNDWQPMVTGINLAATHEIVSATEDALSEWGWALGRVGAHTDTVVETLRQAIAAYVLADLLGVEKFTPTEDNMAKLPMGDAGLKAWEHGARPDFDAPPQIRQDPFPDEPGTGDGDVPIA